MRRPRGWVEDLDVRSGPQGLCARIPETPRSASLEVAGGGAALQTDLPNALYAAVVLLAALAIVAAYDPERLADVEVSTTPSGSRR